MKQTTLKLSLTFLIALFTLTSFAQNKTEIQKKEIPTDYGYIVKIGEKAPSFSMQLSNGKQISTVDFKGKVIMLQFTASWCGVCRKEMPEIEKQIWLKHKNNPNFLLYGIDLKESLDKVQKFATDMKITYPLGLDPEGAIFNLFAEKNAGVTRNVIIDKNGKIVYMTRLYKEEEFNEMISVIETLLH